MAKLLFTPRTGIDANLFQFRLDNSPFHATWDVWTGSYEFREEENIYQLEEDLSLSLTYDIDGFFEVIN